MAFVSGVSVGTKAFLGTAKTTRVPTGVAAGRRSTVTMVMSKSVPFLEQPKNCVGLPASAEFDPLGFSNVIPIKFLQEAEIKHCRICMLAVLGFLVQEVFTWGGTYFPKMAPVDAHDFYMKSGGMSQILMFIAGFEFLSCAAVYQTMQGKREPGYFGFDPLNLGKDPAAFEKFQVNEIKNGRLAMIAVGGFIHQYWATNQTVLDQLTNFRVLSNPEAGVKSALDALVTLRHAF
mmetsp:Transcript_5198/g.22245  ORF Transcript_5198/g.22245 Transcript_5198/m.22245 type:complete len:233 (-) Transcript_5198:190-888(-)|eukprot:CAMPEP_0113962134 /NCGR_PEP_ID=MMETSP0011_2-20120614/5733_1 /TAXON_ID=101924 /ORGANISM="Rhodosorus marinus" /LENGTH=232 /DNA_ID=CAMNT_0000973927 /DNA_START=142 /DNA_END=840 /DNA_ORIENTATION=- /assembly_acc=CAM_ASM_000156